MDNAATGRVKDLLAKNDKVGVLVGKNPTLDQMASALSLYLSLQQLGKNVTIASPSEPIVGNSSLVGIDKVKTAFAGDGGDLVVSFPYREGEIEKVSYTLDDGFLNIVVKATEEGLTFEQQDVIFKRSGGLPTLIFIIGTPRLSDLGQLFDADALKDTAVINIDNHTDNQGFGDVVLVSPQASSVSELIGNLLNALQVNIDQDIAQNLLSGLSDATENFQNSATTFLAFEMAATFLKKGAKRVQITQQKQSDTQKSPFGPFTMPQPRSTTSKASDQSQSHDGQTALKQQQSREQRPRPWEQRSAQTSPASDSYRQAEPSRVSQQPRAPLSQVQPPVQQPRPMQEVEHKESKEDLETPPDWLAPKVYKSSTLI